MTVHFNLEGEGEIKLVISALRQYRKATIGVIDILQMVGEIDSLPEQALLALNAEVDETGQLLDRIQNEWQR